MRQGRATEPILDGEITRVEADRAVTLSLLFGEDSDRALTRD
jgi:hypothetical protein